MKIRIKGNSVRLRVSRNELDQIGRGEQVAEQTCFGQSVLSYGLRLDPSASELNATFDGSIILVGIPPKMAQEWVHTDAVSLRGVQPTPQGGLQLLVEKDFQCLAPRDEDESDLFINPKAGNEAC